MSSSDYLTGFIDFLRGHDLAPGDSREIMGDDRIRRFTLAGDKPRSKNGVYRLGYLDGIWIGWARSHKQGQTHNYCSKNQKDMTPEERTRLAKMVEQRKADNEARLKARQQAAADEAWETWQAARYIFGPHPYTERKRIEWRGLRALKGDLIIPLYDIYGKLWNVQRILPQKDSAGNDKYFITGGRVKGCYHPIGKMIPLSDDPFLITEGFATGRTLYRVFGFPVVCAIQANNLPNVGALLRRKYPYGRLVYCADNDLWTKLPNGQPDNPGVRYAKMAALATRGSLQTLPRRLGYHALKPTDFNDMANIEGDESVRNLFHKVLV